MGSSPLTRTVLPLLVMAGGFAALYAWTGYPQLCLIWSMLAAHVVLLMPWSVDGGRANHASVLFMQPAAASERGREQIVLTGVTPGQRREAAVVVAAVFALPLAAGALMLAG